MIRAAPRIDLPKRDEAALEDYRRLVEEAEAPQAVVLARAGDLEIRFGDPAVGAQHLARAVEIYAEAGLLNLALALSHRLLHLEPPPVDEFLRLGELSAAKGYARDARFGYLEYAERRERSGDTDAACSALEAYLRSFPDDATVRRRLAEISGAPAPAEPAPPAAPAGSPDLDVLPTLMDLRPPAEEPEAAGSDGEALLTHNASPVDADSFQIAPLEGLESNHADGAWEQPAQPPESVADSLPLLGFGPDFDSPAEEAAAELAGAETEEDPLPLLGLESLPERRVRPEPEPEPAFEAEADESFLLAPPPRPADEYVDLGALILNDEADLSSPAPHDDDPRLAGEGVGELEEILALLGEQMAETVDPGEAASHYDLGLAFKEMGLLDDAIAQLQRALRGGAHLLATLEVLGECFIGRGEPERAAHLLQCAAQLHGAREPELVGVLYWLGRSHEELGARADARIAYERVAATDVGFRDVAERLEALRGE